MQTSTLCRAHGELYPGEKLKPGVTYMKRTGEEGIIPQPEFDKLKESCRLHMSAKQYDSWLSEWSVWDA